MQSLEVTEFGGEGVLLCYHWLLVYTVNMHINFRICSLNGLGVIKSWGGGGGGRFRPPKIIFWTIWSCQYLRAYTSNVHAKFHHRSSNSLEVRNWGAKRGYTSPPLAKKWNWWCPDLKMFLNYTKSLKTGIQMIKTVDHTRFLIFQIWSFA